MPVLLAVPNVSTAGDEAVLHRFRTAFGRRAHILDVHTDPDHGRTVFTLAGEPGGLAESLVSGAEEALESIDMSSYVGMHPAIGALDVCPVVWLREEDRDAARTEAVAVANQIGGIGVPTFLYGELAREPGRAERAYFRNGGLAELWLRMEGGELRPDFGPPVPHPHGGATLVTARAPLAAFNVELEGADLDAARAVAAELREAGGGARGVRAIGLMLSSGRAQVSTNVHDPLTTTLGTVVEEVRRLAAPLGARPVEAELVGLIPAAAIVDYPADVPIRGFDPEQHVIERRLAALGDRVTDPRSRTPTGNRSSNSIIYIHQMAQPKNKRRRKRRGTQGGRIDTAGRRARPRNRAEARNRARSSGSKSASKKRDLPPTWKGSAYRGAFAAVIFIVILIVLFKRPLPVSLIFGAFMLVFYIPTGYYIDMSMWRKRERQRIRDREGDS